MEPTKDYYKILGVAENVSTDAVKSAYRKLAKKYHPDMNPNDRKGAEQKFKEMSEAYYVLGDQKRKQEYDMMRKGGYAYDGRAGQSYANTQGFDIEDLLSHLGYATSSKTKRGPSTRSGQMDFDIFDDIFGDSFSSGERRGYSRVYSAGAPAREQVRTDINAQIEIPSRLATTGGKVDLSLSNRKNITVNIPKGVTNNTKLRLAGLGEPCPCCGKKGDLLLKITIKYI
ncbi:MAG: DnaJ domain-containing protein [Candidatus Margulisiibacteriota bacterium]